jgi:hypothetical protein
VAGILPRRKRLGKVRNVGDVRNIWDRDVRNVGNRDVRNVGNRDVRNVGNRDLGNVGNRDLGDIRDRDLVDFGQRHLGQLRNRHRGARQGDHIAAGDPLGRRLPVRHARDRSRRRGSLSSNPTGCGTTAQIAQGRDSEDPAEQAETREWSKVGGSGASRESPDI